MASTLDEELLRDADAAPQAPADILTKLRGAAAHLRMQQLRLTNAENEVLDAKAEIKRLSESVLPSLMDTAGLKDFTLDTDDRLLRGQSVHTSIAQDDMREAVKWLDKHKFGDLVRYEIKIPLQKGDDATKKKVIALLTKERLEYALSTAVHPQTLKAFGKKAVEQGLQLPAAIAVHVQPRVELIPPKSTK